MKPAHQVFAIVALGMLLFGLQSTSGLTLAAALGCVVVGVSLLAIRSLDPGGRIRLAEIFLLAVTLRWLVSAIAFLWIGDKTPGFIAPDEIFYDDASVYFSEYLAGHVPDPSPNNFAGGVIWVSGSIYYMFGFVPMVPRLLNCIVGAWAAVAAGLIAARLLDDAVGRRAAFIAAITPSLVVWSVVNTKDASTLLGGEVALLAFLALRERFSVQALGIFGAGLLYVAAYRPYEILYVGGGAIAGFIFTRQGDVVRNLLVGVGLTVVLALVVRATGATDLPNTAADISTMEAIATLREGYATGAGSAININLVDTSTPTGLALWAPIGLFYFYFAPFPFTGTSLASLATSPEMIALYFLVPSIIRGARHTFRHRFRESVPLLAYVIASSVGWSLVVTNVGSLYRYRSQVLFVLIIFVATDMVRRRRAALAPRAVDPVIAGVLRAREARTARLAGLAPVHHAPTSLTSATSLTSPTSIDQPGPRPLPSPAPAGR